MSVLGSFEKKMSPPACFLRITTLSEKWETVQITTPFTTLHISTYRRHFNVTPDIQGRVVNVKIKILLHEIPNNSRHFTRSTTSHPLHSNVHPSGYEAQANDSGNHTVQVHRDLSALSPPPDKLKRETTKPQCLLPNSTLIISVLKLT